MAQVGRHNHGPVAAAVGPGRTGLRVSPVSPVNDAAPGDLQIEPFSLDGWPGGQHPWGCQIQLAGATYPHHFIKGVLPIAEEIVRTA